MIFFKMMNKRKKNTQPMQTELLIFRLVRSAESSELMPAPSDSVNLDYEGARQKTWIISLSPFIITPVILITGAFFW